MASSKVKIGQADQRNGESQPISKELRSWIDHVIVPILVKEFIRAQGLQTKANDG